VDGASVVRPSHVERTHQVLCSVQTMGFYQEQTVHSIGVSQFVHRVSATVHVFAFLAVRDFVNVYMPAWFVHMIRHSGTLGQTPLRLSLFLTVFSFVESGHVVALEARLNFPWAPLCLVLSTWSLSELRTCPLVL